MGALVLVMLMASLLEAWIWSLAYVWVAAVEEYLTALYFSVVTFTTLGYGDVTPKEGWRLLAAMQSAVGAIMFGWTTALVIAAVQRLVVLEAGERK